jgi:CRP-like cAMP-binding protein
LDRLVFAEEVRSLLAPYARQRVFAAGEKLWQEGDDAGMLVAIETGHVRIFRGLGARRVVTLYLFGPGAVFGFMPLLDGGPYPASAIALEETTAQVVLREDLQRAFRRDPDLALGLVRLLATRLREAFARIEQASVPEVLPLVATALVSLLPAEATPGIVPESLSRALTKLVDAGVLHRLAPRRLQVLDPGGLRRAANTTAPRPSSKRATPARSRR